MSILCASKRACYDLYVQMLLCVVLIKNLRSRIHDLFIIYYSLLFVGGECGMVFVPACTDLVYVEGGWEVTYGTDGESGII